MKKSLVSLLAIILILPSFFASAQFNQSIALSYLTSHSNNAWSTMGQVSFGETNIATDYLKNISGSSAIEYTAPILAITSIGRDPRTFGANDLVAKLKSYASNGQIGDAQTLNDDFFGVLALVASGESINDPVITSSKNFILIKQNSDGGWGFIVSSTSDSNMTAAGILSLLSAGVSASDPSIVKAKNFLLTLQNSDGGFGYNALSTSDSSSTAWVIWAFNALSINSSSVTKNNYSPKEFLESLQDSSGYFRYQANSSEDNFSVPTTGYAAIALSGKFLPLKKISPIAKTYSFRIEGSQETVCEGKTTGPTALDVVKNAKALCGFDYEIQDTSFGPYLKRVNSDTAAGLIGWLYLVNSNSPDVGAADYKLEKNDTVLWYYGDYAWLPSRLSLNNNEIASNARATATVESYSGGDWQPINQAQVLFGTETATTNASGQTNLSPQDGFYKIYSQTNGFIRSNKVLLKVGSPASNSINLNLTVESGKVLGEDQDNENNETIAFTADTTSIDFGKSRVGGVVNKNLAVKNTGNVNINLQSVVSGDLVFKDTLKVNNIFWRLYKEGLNISEQKNLSVQLTVPQTSSGNRTGQLILWAEPK